MPFAGRSHFWLIYVLGAVIAIVFILSARLTNASRREVVAAFVGGLIAGAVNVGTDTAAYALGYWRYPEATTPFGPLVYYVEAGIGCGALALIARFVARRRGPRAALSFVGVFALYGPIRDYATAETTHLIEFHYDPAPIVIVADSLSGFVIPIGVAYAVIWLISRPVRVNSAPP